MLLVALPWTRIWTENTLLTARPRSAPPPERRGAPLRSWQDSSTSGCRDQGHQLREALTWPNNKRKRPLPAGLQAPSCTVPAAAASSPSTSGGALPPAPSPDTIFFGSALLARAQAQQGWRRCRIRRQGAPEQSRAAASQDALATSAYYGRAPPGACSPMDAQPAQAPPLRGHLGGRPGIMEPPTAAPAGRRRHHRAQHQLPSSRQPLHHPGAQLQVPLLLHAHLVRLQPERWSSSPASGRWTSSWILTWPRRKLSSILVVFGRAFLAHLNFDELLAGVISPRTWTCSHRGLPRRGASSALAHLSPQPARRAARPPAVSLRGT
jgi:hypothetical protein